MFKPSETCGEDCWVGVMKAWSRMMCDWIGTRTDAMRWQRDVSKLNISRLNLATFPFALTAPLVSQETFLSSELSIGLGTTLIKPSVLPGVWLWDLQHPSPYVLRWAKWFTEASMQAVRGKSTEHKFCSLHSTDLACGILSQLHFLFFLVFLWKFLIVLQIIHAVWAVSMSGYLCLQNPNLIEKKQNYGRGLVDTIQLIPNNSFPVSEMPSHSHNCHRWLSYRCVAAFTCNLACS